MRQLTVVSNPFPVAAWGAVLSEKSWPVLTRFHALFGRLGVSLALGTLSGSATQLRRAVPKLPRASRYLERQFLGFQKTLEELSSASRDLILHGHRVVKMASGAELGEISFSDVFALLEGPLAYLAETQSAMQELSAGLRGSVEAISRLLEIERGLEATVAPLQITQVMFRIQSAYLPSEHRQVFNSVTDEIVTLQGQIQSAFSEHARVLSGLHGNLLAVVEALERQRATHGQKVLEKRTALSSFLQALTEEIKNNALRDVALTGASEELGQKVGAAIVTLQTQDIVAQKLEHARGGIGEVMKVLADCEARHKVDCFARMTAMARIEAAQLDGVATELEQCGRSLQDASDGVNQLLAKLHGDTLLLKEFREMTVSATGGIQGLLESLEEIREMVGATLATSKMAEESVLPVRTATEGLTNTVQGVAHEMRLIALNSQIQAIQMGEGTGLDVLAAHSTEVSQSTTRISEEVALKVAEVASVIAAQSDRLSALREAGQRQQDELEQKGQLQEAALHRFRDATLEEFRATGAALDRARELGAALAGGIDVQPAVDDIRTLRAAVWNLQQGSARAAAAFGHKHAEPLHFSDLERKYTMASERRVHAQALGRGVVAAPVAAVELWEEAATEESDRQEPVRPAAEEFGDGVELF